MWLDLVRSDENQSAKNRGIVPALKAEFCAWSPETLKVLVIGNCQGPNLARALHLGTGCSVLGVEIMTYHGSPDLLLEEIDGADIVISCLLGESWGSIATHRLRARLGHRLRTYNAIYWNIFPDICYRGAMGQRLRSPMGDYHSITLHSAFGAGLSEEEALRKLLEGPDPADIKSAYAATIEETGRREEDADVRIGPWLQTAIKERPQMLTINHPASTVFVELARSLSATIGLDFADFVPELFHSTLTQDVVWPVHPRVSETLDLDYVQRLIFTRGSTTMTAADFVALSFEMYRQEREKAVVLER